MPVENTPPALPPTPTRVRLARDIHDRLIRHWHFVKPETRDDATDRLVTARVAELVTAGLAVLGTPLAGFQTSIVALTPAGEEWLAKYGSSE